MIDLSLFLHLSSFEYAMAALLLISFIVQQLYIWNVYGRVAFHKKNKKPAASTVDEGVSVIICVRNEKELLEKHLSLFLAQNHSKYEIVLVNDCSEVDSELLLGVMKTQYPNLQVRHIPKDDKFKHGKPMALGVGIKAAKYDWLLFSDIDCAPNPEWLSTMQNNFTAKVDLVLGYASYPKASKLVRCDIFYSAIHYLGFALMKKTYMANSKNYAYRRKLFFDSKGFDIRMTKECENIVFINKIATKTNTLVELSPRSLLKSTHRLSYNEWIQQKLSRKASFRFHGSKKRYPALLSNISMLLFFAATIFFCTKGLTMSVAAGVFVLIHFIALAVALTGACKRLMEKKLLTNLMFFSIIAPFISIKMYLKRK